ncbi:MAG: flagellar motor switch protein FliN [Lentisphaerae bacterium]|nr:flagellar motor switch protein FliN [Lentisphaerota bacterium]
MSDDPSKPEESMTDIERQMAQALEDSEQADTGSPAPEPDAEEPGPTIRRVEMDAVKTVPRSAPDPDGNLKLILDIAVEVRVEVGNSRLTISELLNLAPGSIVELDRTAGSPADLIVNGTKIGQGDVVVVDESYGIRLTKLVDPQDRINSL